MTKKDTTKKDTKKTTKKAAVKKVPVEVQEIVSAAEAPVEEVNLVGAATEEVMDVLENMKEDDTIFVVGNNTEVMNGDPAVITPVEEPEPVVSEEVVVEGVETKDIKNNFRNSFGYLWNGQEIDY